MKYGSQTKLARIVGCTVQTLHGLFADKNTRHVSYRLANAIADETKTDISLWMRGGTGTPESRREAIQAWAASTQ